MAQVNPQLGTIIEKLGDYLASIAASATASLAAQVATNAKLDLIGSQLGELRVTVNDLYEETGLNFQSIRTRQDSLYALLDGVRADNASYATSIIDLLGGVKADTTILTENTGVLPGNIDTIRDNTAQTAATLDIVNNNLSGNFQNLLGFLDVMNNNAAANAIFLKEAICGDCDAVPPAIDSGGFLCRTSASGTSGSDPTVEFSIGYNIGPGVVGAVGDSARLRVLSSTAPIASINFYDGPAFGSTPTPLTVGGPYIEYVIGTKPGTLVVTPETPGPFNITLTQCFLAAPS